MTDHVNAGPRLLPWTSPDGNPCFLFPGDGTGYVSRLADRMEAEQLGSAAVLIEEAERVLSGRAWTAGELQLLTLQLKDSLVVVHRVAESRGARLPVPDDEPVEPSEAREPSEQP
ncbi:MULTISPECIES: hypothetical protein [Streptomyces]|uniref:Uncharacterized protein n=2 Tax=Streptomyces TaxID=1883 RepID=A0A2N8PNB8_STRNR|nr:MULTISPECIES: hypothetical protein [Streptomyces]PNE42515.1 hypothetical protein AOB60_18905 [Streptomyces noursei]SHK84534.1 hypothetical protein SAMN05216268_101520 [Streptomyces yunnanensis]